MSYRSYRTYVVPHPDSTKPELPTGLPTLVTTTIVEHVLLYVCIDINIAAHGPDVNDAIVYVGSNIIGCVTDVV